MKAKLVAFCLCVLTMPLATLAQTPAIFHIKPIALANGWRVTGTITTDGSVGVLNPNNIVDWNLLVVQTMDLVWTEKDSNDLNISGVSSTGKKVMVATSPDGVLDGGTLVFSKPVRNGTIPTSAIVADFTQLSVNLGYVGGLAGWQDEVGGLNFVGLNQRNNIKYRAASVEANKPNVFRISVPTLATSPLLMTMFGTITTDGTVGPLAPQNIVAWNITARSEDVRNYTKANSAVRAAIGVTTDGQTIKVAHTGGQLVIGFGSFRPTYVTLADFTDPTYPDGFANYYDGSFGEEGDKFPLTTPRAKACVVAN